MGCTSSKYVPWAGRTEITLAAKARKKAAKEILASHRAYSGCHAAYLDTLKLTGHNLAVFLEVEDKALLNGPVPAGPVLEAPAANQEPPSYQTSWSKTPGSFTEKPVLEQVEGKAEGSGSAQPGMGQEQLGMPKEEAPFVPPGHDLAANELAPAVPQAAPAPVPAGPLVPVSYGSYTAWRAAEGYSAAQLGPRGAGLAQLGQALSALCAEAEQAARPLSDLLVCGMPRNYSALPPLPPYAQGRGYPGQMTESLWDVLEMLVAYEQFRSRETKAMEKAKWEHARSSGRLEKQTRQKVAADKEAQQMRRINTTQSKVQTVQATIARLGQSVEGATRAIEAIKGAMLYPALLRLLPAMIQACLHISQIHERQRQLVTDLFANGDLMGRHVAGPGVLFTQKNHKVDTEAFKAVLGKLEQTLSASNAAQKKVVFSIVAWLRRVDPANAVATLKPVGAPLPPSYGSSGQPQAPSGQPYVTYPPEPGQIIPYQHAGAMGPGGPTPNPEVVRQFLDGSISGGEPLVALCSDWLRALDRLGEGPVKDALHVYSSWLQDVLTKQAAELKQAKKVEDTRKQMGKAEAKFDSLLRKEKEFRATLTNPQEGPMSRALSSTHGSPAPRMAAPNPYPPSVPSPDGVAPSEGGTPPPAPRSVADFSPASSGAYSYSGALQVWQSPQAAAPSPAEADEAVDKAGAKALAKEQAKEVKAFQMGKEVDLAKGVLEGLKVKVREEQAALEAMALDARVAAVRGLEQALPGLLHALTAHYTVASQMYAMLHYQHRRG